MVNQDNLAESSAIGVTAVVLLAASVIALLHLRSFYRQPYYPSAQKYLICIFLMPIFIGWSAWIELLREEKAKSVDFTINVFKSLCLASFMMYIDKMLGWVQVNGKNIYSETKMLEVLCSENRPQCLFGCVKFNKLKTIQDSKNYLFRMRLFVFQFCVVLLVLGITGGSIMLSTGGFQNNSLSESSIWLWFTLMQSISSIFALCYLLGFGMYVNKIPEMANLQILHKFGIIKLGILFTEFQPLIIGIFSDAGVIANTSKFSTAEITLYTNSLLLCSEMVIMSFLLILIYPIEDYCKSPDLRKSIALEDDSYFKM